MRKTLQLLRLAHWAACICIFSTGCANTKQASPVPPQTAAAAAPTISAEPAAAPVQSSANGIFRVKAGLSTPYTDSSGNVWLPDQGFEGGDTIEREAGTAIAGTKDPAMFLTERYGMNSFSCKIPNGKYTAKLYFAETFDGVTGPGQRVFSFDVQGRKFSDFDLWVKAGGPNRPYIETVPVEITNGSFRIQFTSKVENPEINAIEIIPQL